jgi:hypothetical protein
MILRLRVAGLTLAVSARKYTESLRLPRVYDEFLVSRGSDMRLDLSTDPIPQPHPARLLFDSSAVWSTYWHKGGLLYTFRTPRLNPPVFKAVAIDRSLQCGVLYFPHLLTGKPPHLALDFPLDELLFQHRLAREGAIELHACGVLQNNRALLFCGQSGAGKTTTAKLWKRHCPDVTILSDDRVVLRTRRNRPIAHGTPWHGLGGFASSASGPLRAVCFLRHASRPSLKRLPPPDAAARLFARTFPPLWDTRAAQATLRTCSEIAESIPCYDFGFRPDKSAVSCVQCLLRS